MARYSRVTSVMKFFDYCDEPKTKLFVNSPNNKMIHVRQCKLSSDIVILKNLYRRGIYIKQK